MTHNFSIHRVRFREVFAWKIDLSIVERSCPDRDRAMLLRLWNRQHSFNICPKHRPRIGAGWGTGGAVSPLRLGRVDEMST